MQQLKFFLEDIKRILGKKNIRILILPFAKQFWGVLSYRTERSLYLIFKKYYSIVRLPLTPMFALMQFYSNMDIHYKADIKGGIAVFHPVCGIVISGLAKIGKNLTLTGGNIIGTREQCSKDQFLIGDNCSLGANAVILGPIKIANNVKIGAAACVVKDCLKDGSTLIGVPANI